jgi:pentatricopeptide repeat protein
MTRQGRSKRRRAPAQGPAARSGASARDAGTRWRRPWLRHGDLWWCKSGRIEDAVKVFDEMLAAGDVMPTAVMYNALIGGRRGEGSGRHGPNASRPRSSRRRRNGYGVTSRKERRWSGGGDWMQRARRSHARQAPFIHAEIGAGVTWRGFDAQRMTGGGGRPVLMASQWMERAAGLQNPEVRAELNRRVHECERKCFTSGRLGSIP